MISVALSGAWVDAILQFLNLPVWNTGQPLPLCGTAVETVSEGCGLNLAGRDCPFYTE
jgi:hypothetical protein